MAWDNKGENKDATFKEQMLAKVRNALIERQEALFKDIDQRTETWVPIKEEDGTAITFVLQCMKVKSESEAAQSCPTLSDPMDFSPPGSSIHGIFQARVLERGAIAVDLKEKAAFNSCSC